MLSESPRERIDWILTESVVLFAVLAFWAVAVGVLILVLNAVGLVFRILDLRMLEPFLRFLTRADAAWAAVLPLAFASAGLYVAVRAGTLLIDHYRATEG